MVGWKGVAIIGAFAAAVTSTMLTNVQVPETLKAADALEGRSTPENTQSQCAKKSDPQSGLEIYQPKC